MGSSYMLLCSIRTKFVFANARIIRFPIDLRGRRFIKVGTGFTTGKNCRIEALPLNPGSNVKTLIIGNDVQINDNVHITAAISVVIGNHVLIASKVYISDISHGNYKTNDKASMPTIPPAKRPLSGAPVIIEDNVWLGDGVCVLPGVTIGKGSIIGANAVVSRSIPPNTIAAGIPAEVIKQFDYTVQAWVNI